jgi:8-oxo-dGTP pyrophosphatase MutT (NUDIX family)
MPSAAELLEDLRSHTPLGEPEATSLDRIRSLLQSSDDPFTRARTEHVTGSAVVARPAGDAYLLVHHRRLGRWLQPGGHVEEEDETVFASALREAREETGVEDLQAPFGKRVLDVDVHPIPAFDSRPLHIHFDVRYLFTTPQEILTPSLDEVLGAAWFSIEEALAADVDGSLARALTKARGWLTEF